MGVLNSGDTLPLFPDQESVDCFIKETKDRQCDPAFDPVSQTYHYKIGGISIRTDGDGRLHDSFHNKAVWAYISIDQSRTESWTHGVMVSGHQETGLSLKDVPLISHTPTPIVDILNSIESSSEKCGFTYNQGDKCFKVEWSDTLAKEWSDKTGLDLATELMGVVSRLDFECPTCDGSQVIDSGGVTFWDEAIFVPCPECVKNQ